MGERYVTFRDSGIHVDIGRYLRSRAGKEFLERMSLISDDRTICEDCEGTGIPRGYNKRCTSCDGSGYAIARQRGEEAK